MGNDSSATEPYMWVMRYGRAEVPVSEMQTSEPVRVGDTIRELLKDWKFDPLPKDDSAL